MPFVEVTPNQALERYLSGDAVILDVRTWPEWVGGHIPGAVHIPLDQLTARYQELNPDAETLVVCAHGVRSAAAGEWLEDLGFNRIRNVRWGMAAWDGPVETGP